MPSKTKIAIVGSRDFAELDKVRDYVNSLPLDCIIVSGGARGVDRVAEQTASVRGMQTIIFKPDWEKHGKAAGFIRNHDIIQAADSVVAFWDGTSKGTKNSIDLATKLNKPCTILK